LISQAGNHPALASMSVLSSFHKQLPFDTPLMTTLPGEPSIIASSTKKSFNIMAKESFKKLMREGQFSHSQNLHSLTQRQ
jgi:hypothetical protein